MSDGNLRNLLVKGLIFLLICIREISVNEKMFLTEYKVCLERGLLFNGYCILITFSFEIRNIWGVKDKCIGRTWLVIKINLFKQ